MHHSSLAALLALAVLCAVAPASAADALPSNKPFFKPSQHSEHAFVHLVPEPSVVRLADGAERHTVDFKHTAEDGGFVELFYQVDMHPEEAPVHLLDDDEGVSSVECVDGGDVLRVQTQSEEVARERLARWREGAFLTGTRQFRCVHGDGKVKTMLRRVVSAELTQGGELVVATESAQYSDVYRHATIRFKTNRFAQLDDEDSGSDSESGELKAGGGSEVQIRRPAQRKLLGFFSGLRNFAKKAWHKVESWGATVATVAKDVYEVGKAAVTGDLDVSPQRYDKWVSWNYDRTNGRAAGPIAMDGVTCDDCYFGLDAMMEYEMRITDYNLKYARIVVGGDVYAGVSLDSVRLGHDFSWDKGVANPHWFIGAVTIGPVPFTFELFMPIHVGVDLTVEAEVRLGAYAQMSGSGRWGVEYNNNNWHTIHTHDFHHSGALSSADAGYSLSVGVTPYVSPILVLVVDHIGGPSLSVKPSFTLMATIGDEMTNEGCSNDASALVTLSAGVSVALGFTIDIDLVVTTIEKTWTMKPIVDYKKQITAGCLTFNTALNSQGQSLLADEPGVRYSPMPPALTVAPSANFFLNHWRVVERPFVFGDVWLAKGIQVKHSWCMPSLENFVQAMQYLGGNQLISVTNADVPLFYGADGSIYVCPCMLIQYYTFTWTNEAKTTALFSPVRDNTYGSCGCPAGVGIVNPQFHASFDAQGAFSVEQNDCERYDFNKA